MKGPKALEEFEDNWKTDLGAWFPEERVVFRGKDLFSELRDMPWMGMFIYGITGRMPDEKQIRLFEGIWVLVTSFPDPRIWPNRVAALAGTTRSTGILAMSSAIAAFEANILGGRATLRAAEFLVETKKSVEDGEDLKKILKAELKKNRAIPGFGRPISTNDERIEPVMEFAKSLGCSEGEYVKHSFKIREALAEMFPYQFTINMTIASLISALALDEGLSPKEFYHVVSLCPSAGMKACFIDAEQKPEGALYPLRCSRINYIGKPRRTWE